MTQTVILSPAVRQRIITSGLANTLKRHIQGDVLFDIGSRARYATDSSPYQIPPIGIVVPYNEADVFITFKIAKNLGIPILIRGSGTSQNGQAVGESLIIDTSHSLNKLLSLDINQCIAVVQPGMLLEQLNAQLKPHNLWFPVDATNATQATIGGMAGNNTCGTHGKMVHHIKGIDAIFTDGTEAYFGSFGLNDAPLNTAKMRTLVSKLFELNATYKDVIAAEYLNKLSSYTSPHTRTRGYNLDVFNPSLQKPRPYTLDGSVNLAHLLVGSEGTLAYFKRLHLQLAPLPSAQLIATSNCTATVTATSVKSLQNNNHHHSPQILAIFKQLKALFDPDNRLNPSKIVELAPLNKVNLMRHPPGYTAQAIAPALNWQAWNKGTDTSGGLASAIARCDGHGDCRTLNTAISCPSYRITRQEKDSPRGRANTLRFALTGQIAGGLNNPAVAEVMALCVSCKACKPTSPISNCPKGIDIAKLKIEVLSAQREQFKIKNKQNWQIRWRNHVMAELPYYAPSLGRMRWLVNHSLTHTLIAKLLGYANKTQGRSFPIFAKPFTTIAQAQHKKPSIKAPMVDTIGTVILLADTFNNAFEPANLAAAQQVLQAAGYTVYVTNVGILKNTQTNQPLCCGRTHLAVGDIVAAKAAANTMIAAVLPLIEQGATLVGLEPSCLLTTHDEWQAMNLGESAKQVANNALLFESFLVREHDAGRLKLNLKPLGNLTVQTQALLHGHCHQKAFNVLSPVQQVLSWIPHLNSQLIESICCGMAGTFGYDATTLATSKAMAEDSLLPTVRAANTDTLIIADGVSCRHQIHDLAGKKALHVAQVLVMALNNH